MKNKIPKINKSTSQNITKDISTKSQTKNYATIIIIFGILIVILSVLCGFLYYQNQKIRKAFYYQLQESPIPSVSPTTTPKFHRGYVGYNPNGKKFTLELPSECKESENKLNIFPLICNTQDFEIEIDPEASGFGIEGYDPLETEEGTFDVGKYTINYKIWIDQDGTAFATYELTDPETNDYYLIHAKFNPFSNDAKQYMEDIISTFKFLEG